MPLNCSLYCLINNPESVIGVVRGMTEPHQLDVDGIDNDWLAFRVHSGLATMVVKRLYATNRDESFTQLITNTQSFVGAIASKHVSVQAELIEHLSRVTQILAFEVDCKHGDRFDEKSEDILFEIVNTSKGIILTDNEFFNAEGGLILDVAGESDEGIIAN